MSLTAGTGPFSGRSPGAFNFRYETQTGAVLFFEPVPQRIRAILAKEVVVDSQRAHLLHESGPLPVYSFPRADVRAALLEPSEKTTHCPHKGDASYWSLRAGRRTVPDAVWAYEQPLEPAS